MPKLGGVAVTPRFAELLSKSSEKQSQQQMTHTQVSTHDGTSILDRLITLEKRLDDRSMIYHSIKSGLTAPGRVLSGELQPYKVNEDGQIIPNESYYQAGMDTAGLGMVGGIPGGAVKPGELGLTYGQVMFRGTKTFDPKVISRSLDGPGEMGMHVSIQRRTAEDPAFVGKNLDGTIIEMKSNVNKPLWLPDAKQWNPSNTIGAIRRANQEKLTMKEAPVMSEEQLKLLSKIEDEYLDAIVADLRKFRGANKEGIAKLMNKYSNRKVDSSKIEESDLRFAIDEFYNKKIQQVIKDSGYDHISYINQYEGAPVESAILFDRESFELLGNSEVENKGFWKSLFPNQVDNLPNEIKI